MEDKKKLSRETVYNAALQYDGEWFEDIDVACIINDKSHATYTKVQRHLNNLVKDGVLIKRPRSRRLFVSGGIQEYKILTPIEIAKQRIADEKY